MGKQRDDSVTRIREALRRLPEGMDPVQAEAVIERIRMIDAAFRRKEESWYDMLSEKGRDSRKAPEAFDTMPTEEEEADAGVGEEGPLPEPSLGVSAVRTRPEDGPGSPDEGGGAGAGPDPEPPAAEPEQKPGPAAEAEPTQGGGGSSEDLVGELEEKQAALKKAMEALAALRKPEGEEGG